MTALDQVVARLREICIDLPEVNETLTFSNPTWMAGHKTFCVFDRYQGQHCICFKATMDKQRALLLDERFFAAPHGGKQGWTCLRVDGAGEDLEWNEIEDLVMESYRMFANRRMLQALDGGELE